MKLATIVIALTLASCAPVRHLPLTHTATAQAGDVEVQVPTVSPSNWFLSQRGGGLSLLAVGLRTHNRSSSPRVLQLDRATLVISDPGGQEAEVVLRSYSSGDGPTPPVVTLDEAARVRPLAAGEALDVWVSFRQQDPLADPALPRRIVLRVPVESGGEIEVVLADPSTSKPRWVDEPIKSLSYGGVSASGTFKEASFGILRVAPKSATGPIVAGPQVNLGFRGGKLRGESSGTVDCCDLGFGFDISGAFKTRESRSSGGPYLGYQAVYPLDRSRADLSVWHGPSIGIRAFSFLAEQHWAKALPTKTTPSVLGYSSFTLAYTHWFRSGDGAGKPGFILVLEQATPDW